LAFSGALQIEEALVPGGNLNAGEAEARCPIGHAGEGVEGSCVAGELGKKNSGAFDGFHCVILLGS